jgi:hypothetical protein
MNPSKKKEMPMKLTESKDVEVTTTGLSDI